MKGWSLIMPPWVKGKSFPVMTALTPGASPGVGDVDLDDPGVGAGGAQDRRVQHIGELHVDGVDGLSGHLLPRRPAGEPTFRCSGFPYHASFGEAALTAAMIFL